MPGLILTCGLKDYVCAVISVKMYRRYTEIMERNDSESVRDAVEANLRILQEIFNVSVQELLRMEAEEVMTVSKEIHFLMQEVITPKFLELNPEHPERIEKEKSAFDEYDEENGYNDGSEERDVWKICRENVDRVVKLCIRILKNSYQQCMETDIISLLDYVAFEIRTIKEK